MIKFDPFESVLAVHCGFRFSLVITNQKQSLEKQMITGNDQQSELKNNTNFSNSQVESEMKNTNDEINLSVLVKDWSGFQ